MTSTNNNVKPVDDEFLVESMKDLMNNKAAREPTDELMQKGEPDAILPDMSKEIKAKKNELQAESEEKFVCQKLGLDCRLDDGDQCMVKGEEAQALRDQCIKAGYNPALDLDNNLSGWLTALWVGDYEAVMGFIAMVKEEEVHKLLEARETLLNVSAIFHVIIGADFLCGSNHSRRQAVRREMNLKHEHEHQKIFTKLLELGANIHAKNAAGYTPLHHCLTVHTNLTTMAMARQLLKAGADPNIQNRFGCSPLFDVAMEDNVEAVKLLLEFGADPDVMNNDGISCRAEASNLRRVMELFCQADKKKAEVARADAKVKAGGSFTLCKVCGVDDDNKRCMGCFMVWYCGEKCQVEDWSAHKKDCKVIKKQYMEVQLVEHSMAGLDNLTQQMYVHKIGDVPSKKHFVVKVQASLEHPQGRLFVYNRDRSLCGYLHREGSEQVYDMLLKSIREEGFMKRKGFYYATYPGKEGNSKKKKNRNSTPKVEIKINPVKILPLEMW